jgi:hypothetical protein
MTSRYSRCVPPLKKDCCVFTPASIKEILLDY